MVRISDKIDEKYRMGTKNREVIKGKTNVRFAIPTD